MQAEPVTDPVAYHGEGPVWSPRWGGLRWVDMLAGDILTLGAGGQVHRRHVATVVAAVRPRRAGGAVLAVERGFALEDAGGTISALPDVWDDPAVRMNEGACDPDGRFYAGSMAYDKGKGAAALYRLDASGSVTVVAHGLTVSNGLDWSPDGTRAYYNDTDTERVDQFDYDPQSGLSNRRPFVATPGARPDGLTVDSQGGVWVAFHGSGQVRRFSPQGGVDEVVEVPVAKVTACTFGGQNLDELYITTSRENLAPGDDPQAGSLFRAHVGVKGMPVREFAA